MRRYVATTGREVRVYEDHGGPGDVLVWCATAIDVAPGRHGPRKRVERSEAYAVAREVARR